MTEKPSYLKLLCKDFVERAENLGYKGKKRDDAVMDYFAGAAMMAKHLGHQEVHRQIGTSLAMIFSVRGYDEVKEIAEKPDKE